MKTCAFLVTVYAMLPSNWPYVPHEDRFVARAACERLQELLAPVVGDACGQAVFLVEERCVLRVADAFGGERLANLSHVEIAIGADEGCVGLNAETAQQTRRPIERVDQVQLETTDLECRSIPWPPDAEPGGGGGGDQAADREIPRVCDRERLVCEGLDDEVVDVLVEHCRRQGRRAGRIPFERQIEVGRPIWLQIGVAAACRQRRRPQRVIVQVRRQIVDRGPRQRLIRGEACLEFRRDVYAHVQVGQERVVARGLVHRDRCTIVGEYAVVDRRIPSDGQQVGQLQLLPV